MNYFKYVTHNVYLVMFWKILPKIPVIFLVLLCDSWYLIWPVWRGVNFVPYPDFILFSILKISTMNININVILTDKSCRTLPEARLAQEPFISLVYFQALSYLLPEAYEIFWILLEPMLHEMIPNADRLFYFIFHCI